jgi:hypothetical protein
MPKIVQCGFGSGGTRPPHVLLIIHGPTLIVDIGFDPAYVPKGPIAPNLGAKGVQALVDTGAFQSFIDEDLAVSLKLPLVDRQHVSGSAGRHEVNMYSAQIHVPSFPFTIYGRFGGVNLSKGGQRHSALIGRTFLLNFKMTYDGTSGAVELLRP